MIQTHSMVSRRYRIRAWQLIAAAVILLTMPVNYRGGAELPHPHAFFQFWSSNDADAFDHHERHRLDHAKNPIGYSLNAESFASSTIHPRPDTPLLSEMSAPGERADGLAIVMLATLLGVVYSVRALRVDENWTIPAGRLPRPEPPPPR